MSPLGKVLASLAMPSLDLYRQGSLYVLLAEVAEKAKVFNPHVSLGDVFEAAERMDIEVLVTRPMSSKSKDLRNGKGSNKF